MFRRTDSQNFGCFETLMVSTLHKTQREAKKDSKQKNSAGKSNRGAHMQGCVQSPV